MICVENELVRLLFLYNLNFQKKIGSGGIISSNFGNESDVSRVGKEDWLRGRPEMSSSQG